MKTHILICCRYLLLSSVVVFSITLAAADGIGSTRGMMFAVADYGSIGTAIAMVVIAFMQFYNLRKSAKRDEAVAEVKARATEAASKLDTLQAVTDQTAAVVDVTVKKLDTTAKTVDEVHKLTNGNMGEQLRIGLVAAETLFALQETPANKILRDTARDKFDAHAKTEQKI